MGLPGRLIQPSTGQNDDAIVRGLAGRNLLRSNALAFLAAGNLFLCLPSLGLSTKARWGLSGRSSAAHRFRDICRSYEAEAGCNVTEVERDLIRQAAALTLRAEQLQAAPRSPLYCCNRYLRGESDVANGTVKWFNGQKGYGFIAPDGGGKDVFVHISAVEKAGLDGLPDGAKVSFDIVPNRGKESAENLRVK